MVEIMFRLAGAYPAAAVGVVTTALAAVLEVIK
jgi:hypothetical protein